MEAAETVSTIYESTVGDVDRYVTMHTGAGGDRLCFGLYTRGGPTGWLTVVLCGEHGPDAVLRGCTGGGTVRGPELLAQTLLGTYGRLGLGAVFDGLDAWLSTIA